MEDTQAFKSSSVDRRTALKGIGVVGLMGAIPSLIASSGSANAATLDVRFGLNANAAIPTAGYDSVFAAFEKKTGIKVVPNRLLYTPQINNYLTSAPDDVLIWNAGNRMRYFAEKNLVSDVSGIKTNVTKGVRQAVTATDGKQYLIPFYNYPWVVFYRKSLFTAKGYKVPTTKNQFIALAKKMTADGIAPVAFADKEGWEAMGTFDILNMRLNGYDFHMQLLNGRKSWADAKVKATFNAFRDLLPYHQKNPLGRTWQEAGQALSQKKAGMYFMGSFVVDQFDDATKDDLDFFPFPEMNSKFGRDSIDAPIDGFMMVKEPDNLEGSKQLLTYLASAEAANLYLKTDKNNVATAKDADTSGYTRLQKKYAEIITSTANVAQYMDRDTRPDFASSVLLPAIQDFLKNPKDVNRITKSIQSQAVTIFAS